MVNLASFWKTEACGQTVLPDKSVLIGQKLVENAKIKKNSNATVVDACFSQHCKSFFSNALLFTRSAGLLLKKMPTRLPRRCPDWLKICGKVPTVVEVVSTTAWQILPAFAVKYLRLLQNLLALNNMILKNFSFTHLMGSTPSWTASSRSPPAPKKINRCRVCLWRFATLLVWWWPWSDSLISSLFLISRLRIKTLKKKA